VITLNYITSQHAPTFAGLHQVRIIAKTKSTLLFY